jgi:hypothetical protein
LTGLLLAQRALGAGEHHRNQALEELDRLKAYSLELADLAEVGNADGQVGEGAVLDDLREVLPVDALDDVEGLNGDAFVRDLGGGRKNAEHGSPAGTEVLHSGLDHLVQALEDHVPSVRVVVVHHRVLERLEEVLLKLEVGEFFLLEETHRELTKRVEGEERDLGVGVTSDLSRQMKVNGWKGEEERKRGKRNLVEVLSDDEEHGGPFETDAVHVVVANLDELLQAEHSRLFGETGSLNLLPRDFRKRTDEVNDGGLREE